jgi:hypothetical protein
VSPLVKYTLGRIGLFLAVLLVLWPVPVLSPLVKLLVALLVSFALSWFVLRGWRDQLAADLADRVERRRRGKERLRAALAGEDEPPPAAPPARSGPAGADPPDQRAE